MKSINPATGVTEREFDCLTSHDAMSLLDEVHAAFPLWKARPIAERAHLMRSAADVLEAGKARYATLMTQEMGKVTREAVSEVEKCAWACRYYADHAAEFLAPRSVETDLARSFISYQPMGAILAIMPWNFPFWQVFRFAAPTLMAGNAALLKHAPNVWGCAEAIEDVFHRAGFPPGVFRNLAIDVEHVGEVVADPRVRAVTLTGSTRAGKAVAALAGSHLKKTVLELGGSDAYLVLEDADVAQAAATCATSRLLNAGQSCIAAKRMLVVDSVYEPFLEALTEQMSGVTFGDPSLPDTGIGPLASVAHRDALSVQVSESLELGATAVLGGSKPTGPGAYYPPTILTDVTPGMPAYEEELFGPVATVIPVRDAEEGVEVANASRYGLGGAVFTQNIDRGVQIATSEIDAGACMVNGFVKSDPRLPFGGVKESGYGRELSTFGMHEFVNIKTVGVA